MPKSMDKNSKLSNQLLAVALTSKFSTGTGRPSYLPVLELTFDNTVSLDTSHYTKFLLEYIKL